MPVGGRPPRVPTSRRAAGDAASQASIAFKAPPAPCRGRLLHAVAIAIRTGPARPDVAP